jgi:hypothetical protein
VGLILGLLLLLGFLFLGPRQMHALFGHVARARQQFNEATGTFKPQLEAEREASLSAPSDDSPSA